MSEKAPTTKPVGGFGGGPMRGGTGEKARNFKDTMRNLVAYLRPHWVAVIMVMVFAIAGTTFTIVGPKLLGNITTQIAGDYINMKAYDGIMAQVPAGVKLPAGTTGASFLAKLPPAMKSKIDTATAERISKLDLSTRPTFDWPKVEGIALLLLGLYILSAILSYIQGWVMTGVTQKVTYRFRRDISEKINRLPLAYFDKRTYGEVLSRVTNDVDTVSQTLNQSLSQIITAVVTIVGIIVMMLTISWQLTIIALLTLPTSFVFIGMILKKSQKQFKQQQKSLGELNGHVEEMYGGHMVMRVFGGEKKSLEHFDGINEELYGSAWKSQFLSGLMMPLMNFFGNLGYVAVAMLGGWLAIQGKLNIGDIQAFIQYVQQFNQPVMQTANIANIMQSTAAAAERVFEFLAEPEQSPEPAEPLLLDKVEGSVEFDNVVFGYDASVPVIRGLSASIKPGARIAIVGHTGAGKTTLVNLLMRFYDLDGGSIRIDGHDSTELRRSDVRRLFGMVLQDTWLFSGTVRENIMYGNPGATEQEMLAVAAAAHVDHFISSLPGGYDMLLDEETSNISSGERQLLTIARAMLADPPMLILDEATSSVDTRTEILIQKAMDNLMQGRTSFIIAHRLSTIREADLILVVDAGNIVEQGTHAELLAAGGFYAGLYQSQFETGLAEENN